ncbi:unnamed protein product [Diatraea saccharalis]|uniref:Uncharacterized protein n=1 Tax=Diatraea saccharalis TaxID=40085 RepID=A0A9N9R8Z6_9NEOP|nr:unnamed protein product [Diatraea saccharalis]
MSQVKTRQTTSCPVFGLPQKLPVSQLPTYNDVMKYYLFIKYQLKPDNTTKEPTVHDISEILAQEILDIWQKASLPTVSRKRVLQLIRAYHDKYRRLMKPYHGRQTNKNYQQKINTFTAESHTLFDICSCKCKLISNCSCSRDSRVPKEEINFLLDQRTTRKMMIGGVDLAATIKKKKKQERKEKSSLRNREVIDSEKPCCSRFLPDNVTLAIESTSAGSSNSEASSPIKIPSTTPPAKKKRFSLPSLALACDRTGVSDRAAAIIASSVLKDVGIVSSNDASGVIDRSKLRRERTKVRTTLQNADRDKIITGIYFDGRKDKTLVSVQKEGKFYRKRVTEDHYVILSEPGNDYFGHVTCPIGSELQKCETMPIVEFTAISSTLPEIASNDLSTDQKYLYDIMTAVSTGIFSSDLANMEPGLLNHSRWLTTANRILRLYVTKTDPDEKLVVLVTYVMKVYGPMWFTIKSNPSCINGAKHLWQTISLSRYLKPDLKKIVDNVIQRNGYFGHPENVLVAMLGDDMESIRELAYQQILKARSETASGIRTFKVPALNFDARDYTLIITWHDLKITEPPLTSYLSDEALKSIVKSGLGTIQNIKKYPCHTQAVERYIKLVTEASSAVCVEHKRDGFIRARLLSRARKRKVQDLESIDENLLDITQSASSSIPQPLHVTPAQGSPDTPTASRSTLQPVRATPAQDKLKNHISLIQMELDLAVRRRDAQGASEDKTRDVMKLRQEIDRCKKELRKKEQHMRHSQSHRLSKQSKIELACNQSPTVASLLKTRSAPGRPRLEEQQPLLLKTIVDFAMFGASAEERRRSEIVRSCRTLTDLHEKLREHGFEISRSGTYLRLLPRNYTTMEGKRHVATMPVKLSLPEADHHTAHVDQHFCVATIRSLETLASVL